METMIKRFKQFENKEDNDYMAQTNVNTIKQAAQYLDEVINRDSKDLPDWVEDKLSRCAQDMQDVHDYYKNIDKTSNPTDEYWNSPNRPWNSKKTPEEWGNKRPSKF